MAGARIQVFGRLRLERDGREYPAPSGRKSRALFAYLVLHANAEHPRERLADLFWGESEEPRARQSLRQALSDVRRALDPLAGYAWLDAGDRAVTLHIECPADVIEFLRDSVAVLSGLPPIPLDPAVAEALDRAAAQPADRLLIECYDDWCIEAREALAERWARSLHALLADARAAADLRRMRQVGEMLLAVDPLQEEAHRAVMEAAALAGDRAAALRQYTTCVSVLEREIGATPSAETIALHDRIRDGLLGAPATDGGVAALVGRDAEMGGLAQRIQAAAAGQGGIVLLTGPAGVGKSRLAAEAAALARRDRWSVVEADAGGAGIAEAYRGWTAVLRALLLGGDAPATSLPEPELRGVAWLLPETRHLAGQTGQQAGNRADLFAGVVAVLHAVTRVRPLLIVLDDLHWADADTGLLLEYVADAAASMPLLVIGAARDDPAAEQAPFNAVAAVLSGRGLLIDVPVAPLSRDGVRTLLRHLSGSREIAGSLADLVYTETEGNPLHAGELWRVMQSQGRLEQDEAGHWRWRGGLLASRERLPLPMRVRATISGRLTTLSAPTRELLSYGAVLGRPWSADLLAEITEAPADGWQAAIEEAAHHGMVRATPDGYAFAHDVIRETVEREIDEASTRSLHLRVGETLERVHAGAIDEHADQLAYHFSAAGPRGVGRAFTYTRRAGERARARFAHEQAIERFGVALDYAEGGLVSDPIEMAGLRMDMAQALARTGRMAETEAIGARALEAYAAAGHTRASVMARDRLARLFEPNINPQKVLRFAGEALELLLPEDTDLYASLLSQWAYARERLGHAADLRGAAETLAKMAQRSGNERIALVGLYTESLWLSNYTLDQRACAELRLRIHDLHLQNGDLFLAAESLADAADSLVRIGAIRDARPYAEEAVAVARRLRGSMAGFMTYPVLIELLYTTGEFDAVDALFEELRPALRDAVPHGRIIQLLGAKGGADMWRGAPTINLEDLGRDHNQVGWDEIRFVGRIWACVESGAFDEARALLDQASALVPHEGEGMRWCVNALIMTYNYNRLGSPERAGAWAPSLKRHLSFQITGAQARLELARTAILSGNLDEASGYLEAATLHYEVEGMRPFLAQAWLEQARIALARNDVRSAGPLLERAEALFVDLGMTPWVAQVRALRHGARPGARGLPVS